MTDKEIRALIERRRKDWRYGNSVEAKYKAEECDDILKLMDEQEETVSIWHDAQTEQPQAKEKILATNEYGDCEVDYAINMALYWPKVIKWAYIEDLLKLDNSCQSCENLQEEPVSEDIEEAAESYAKYERSDGGCGIDVTRLDAFIEGAQWQKKQKPVSEDLEDAAKRYALNNTPYEDCADEMQEAFKAGAQWQKENLWKPADGDSLPIIDREVIALLDNGKVVFAHRPPEYWDGKNIITGKVTRNYPKTYDKGGWNIPDVKWWLDCNMDLILKRNDENNKIDKR